MADIEEQESTDENKRGVKRKASDRGETCKVLLERKRPRREERKDNKSFSKETLNETSYIFHNGFRHVCPYYFTFSTHAKGRWVGRKVFDVFCEEFQSETAQYYEKAIQLGKVTVNSKVATMETVVKDNDLITHLVHRHEPPVTSRPLTILHEDSDVLVIDKPPSIPVHPCGRYRHNSVVFILAKEYNKKNIHTLHRLDRLTSGLLMFGKRLAKVQEMETQIRERKVTKEYLALVKGQFPQESIECNQPIKVESHKLGVCHVDPSGKECSTLFKLIHYDDTKNTSLLKCQPKTGRMHQIRVHLQWLGHPIINDPLYDHPAWGPERGKRGKIDKDMKTVLSQIVDSRFGGESIDPKDERGEEKEEGRESLKQTERGEEITNNVISINDTSQEECETSKHVIINTKLTTEQVPELSSSQNNALHYVKDPDCTECHAHHPDPAHNEFMYLHALRYSGQGWEFATELPEWASNYNHKL